MTRGRPERARSSKPAIPETRYRSRQSITVCRATPTRRAISALANPSPASNTIRARFAAAAGTEARIIEMSWYGEGTVPAALGCAFHARRLQLVSSQVGMVAASHRARWDHARRARAAMALLADDRLDALITDEIAFRDAPQRVPELLAPGAAGLTAAICYEAQP